MRIAMIAENDPAGTAILFARAINRLTGHTCRLITCQTRYTHDFPRDLHLPELETIPGGMDQVAEVLAEADIFHFHMLADEHYPLGPFTAQDFFRGQRIVHHHHGHPAFRSDPVLFQKKYKELGRTHLLVSTPDLLPRLPGAAWLPNIVPLHRPSYQPHPAVPPPPLRVSHSPTRKELKNTAELVRVVRRLGSMVALDLIDDVPHSRCLARKRKSHVVFDHMQGYYGVSSLEGLSQGKAVIAGVDDFNETRIREYFGCPSIPWIRARTERELEARLRELALDPDMCAEAGRESRQFMERYWTQELVVGKLIAFYEQ